VCCGQDHPEAEIAKDETSGEEYGKYTCEVSRVCGKPFSNAVIEGGIYRHVPCPHLFALRNGYQMSDIALAWDIFMEKGYGNCIPYRKLRVLWEEIKEICESERGAWRFKRDNTWRPNVHTLNNGNVLNEENDEELSRTVTKETEIEGKAEP
jgi:hypothetical protein